MHDSSERRPSAGRPSLLSAEQPPAQGDRSVLSQLDGRSAAARGAAAPVRHDRHQRGARAAVFAVAIGGIAILAWLGLNSMNESADATLAAHALRELAPMPAPVKAVAAADAPAPAAVEAAPPVSAAATIQDDLAAALDPPAESDPGTQAPSGMTVPIPAPAEKAGQHDLASLLDAPAAAPAPLKLATAPPDSAARKDSSRNKPAADKPARSEKARATGAAATASKPKVAQKPAPQKAASGKKAAPVDTDVAILAALLAHTKTPEAGSPEEIYKRCATNATAAEVQRCRVRVCQGSAKGAAECKSVRISKVSS